MIFYIVIAILLILYLLNYLQIWLTQRRTGLPGPLPSLPFIHLFSYIFFGATPQHIWYQQLLNKYGNAVALTIFGQVHILVCNPKVNREVLVKKADYFAGIPPSYMNMDKRPLRSGIAVSGERWRCIRNAITPIFSYSNIKDTMKLMKNSMELLINKISKATEENRRVDIYSFSTQMIMEIMVKKAYNVDSNCQLDENDLFMKGHNSLMNSIKLVKTSVFPPINRLFSLFRTLNLDYILELVKPIIKEHRQVRTSSNSRDFINLLLQTQENTDENKRLSEDEILANSIIFPVSGVESTSSQVTFLLHILSIYPEIQERVRDEIDKIWLGKDAELTYDMLNEMTYLDMVYQESQRFYSLSHRLVRLCVKDCEIEGIQFKKGYIVVIPIYSFHNDAEFWPKPNQFIPERFAVEEKMKRDPYVFLPFGHGPRQCVAFKLANMVAKSIVVYLLKDFVIDNSEEKRYSQDERCAVGIIELPTSLTKMKFHRRPKH